MGAYVRQDFSLGWNPSSDAFNCPKNALLRMDNLTLDEMGAVALRQGSAKINTTTLAETYTGFDHTQAFEPTYFTSNGTIAQMTQEFERAYLPTNLYGFGPGDHNYAWELSQGYVSTAIYATDTDVHSLATFTLNSTRYRMTGAKDAIYANGSSIWATVAGSGDTSFGAHLGHILFARSTTKKKFDGTVVRNWGIAAPTGAPTLTAIAADSKTFATCSSSESPGMTSNEGSQAFQPDKSGTANAAVELTPDSTTGRATSTLTFGAATDFTAYTGGQTGTDDDLIDFYDFVTEPQYIDFITLMIDVNDGTFQEDWYEYTFKSGDAIEVVPDASSSLESNYSVEGIDRDQIISDINSANPGTAQSSFRPDKPVSNAGWNHFNVPRGNMDRHGLTSGKNWSTVKAVRIVVQAIAGGSGAAVRFDEIRIIGGAARPLTGKYKVAIVAVRNDGNYSALSAPSTFSSEIEVKAQGIRATLSADVVNALDPQVTELWMYLMGGRLRAFYRVSTLTGGPFGGAQTIDATSSEVTALAANLQMETDNAVPPDSIIGIEGPHYDRTLCLTANYIYPSRQRNPDSFSTGEVVRVGDTSETALWMAKLNERLFVATTRDIYFIDGDWTPQQDGSINVAKRPLGVSNAPISKAMARGKVDGVDQLFYLTAAGWCQLGGAVLTDGTVDLLWRGYTRHGVSFVNITDSTSRFRVAISKNVLFAITPEGTDTTSSATVHAYHFTKRRWYRFTYPQAFRSIYTESDGTLIAGDSAGFVRTLDLATKLDDGALIPVVLWTGCDDNGSPFNSKNVQNLSIRVDTGMATATIAFHLNGLEVANASVSTAQGTADVGVIDVSSVAEFSQVQQRITGSFSTFVMRGYQLGFLDSPQPRVLHDTGFVDLSNGDLQWVRRVWVKAISTVDMTVTPYWDGTAGTSRTITVGAFAGKPYVFPVPLGREDKGRTTRVVITTPTPSQVYWVQWEFNSSGKQRQKTFKFEPDVAL